MCEYINRAILQEDFTMEKTIYDESNGLWYELRGDYYFPCLTAPAEHSAADDRAAGSNPRCPFFTIKLIFL